MSKWSHIEFGEAYRSRVITLQVSGEIWLVISLCLQYMLKSIFRKFDDGLEENKSSYIVETQQCKDLYSLVVGLWICKCNLIEFEEG